MNKGLLIILSGPSGVGKTTVAKRLVQDKTLPLCLSLSATTREIRAGEINGKDYDFLTRQEFEAKIKQGDFLEWAEVHGNLYGTQKHRVEEKLCQGLGVILVIDVQGAAQIRSRYSPVLSIFLRPLSMDDLVHRLRKRDTDSEEVIQQRLEEAVREMDHMDEYDHVLVCDKVDVSVIQLRELIASRWKEK